MKSISIIPAICLFLYSCALEQASPVDYNDAIFVLQMEVKNLITDLDKAPNDEARAQILEELKIQAPAALDRIKEIGGFRGDDQLLNSSLPLFEYYNQLVGEFLAAPIEDVPSILDNAKKELMENEKAFLEGQAVFAEAYELFL